jgi:acylphosphatase
MRVARRYVVSGRVQGVGFRFFVGEVARGAGVSGAVRNLPDGRVEVLAEGEDDAMRVLEAALWRGPSLARVEAVASEVTMAATGGKGFVIDA